VLEISKAQVSEFECEAGPEIVLTIYFSIVNKSKKVNKDGGQCQISKILQGADLTSHFRIEQ
jgi:hypothetical protein